MILTIDTAQPLSDNEKAALRILIGCDPVTEAAPAAAPAPAPTPIPPAAEEATMDDAIQVATKMVAEGKATGVKTALSELGVKRVSDLKGEDIATFINSLS